MIKFIDWWFAETWKIPHGLMVFFAYIILIRNILLYVFDIDYMIMDGMVFSIILVPTIIGPQIKKELMK